MLRVNSPYEAFLKPFLKAASLQPALRLLVDQFPRRRIIGQQTPRRTRAYDPARRVERKWSIDHAPQRLEQQAWPTA